MGWKWKWKWLSRVLLCDPVDHTVHGILPARILELVSFPFSRGSFQPRLNLGLLHCRRILYQLSHQGSPRILEWAASPFSRGPSSPRNRTGVSCIAGGFFTHWAMREALTGVVEHTERRQDCKMLTLVNLSKRYKEISLQYTCIFL